MNADLTLWFFVALLVLGTANLLIATVAMRRRAVTRGTSAIPVLDIISLGLITLVLAAALIIVVQLIAPAAPAVGRPLMYLVGAVLIEVLKRLFALLPNAPRWLPGLLRALEVLLLALAVIGLVLMLVLRAV